MKKLNEIELTKNKMDSTHPTILHPPKRGVTSQTDPLHGRDGRNPVKKRKKNLST